MGNFLRENWIWIAAPIVLVVGLVVVVIMIGSQGDSPFIYNIW
ncbi:MAG TPA: DUF5989 family protein [Planctomycetota bacterium]|nr:DUF5989 family protein [Planctomycetota bacterium]